MITVKHLAKIYQHSDGTDYQVLRDVNCHIEKGEVISVIGPSGSGKSTFLRTLNLLDPPTSGEIIVDGQNILASGYDLNKLRQKMGMVFQNFNLFEHFSVLQNVTFAPIKLLGMSKEQAKAEAMEYLGKVGMAERCDAMPDTLSGGQKQRVAIARCLAMKPDIILFDEPTSALDPTMVGEVQGVIRTIAQEGMTMIIVTHKMRFAKDVSTRTFFMYDGIIYEDGTSEQIFNHPQKHETRAFVQRIRTLKFQITARTFDFYDMMSQIRQFCIRYAIHEKMNSMTHIIEEMLLLNAKAEKPMNIEVNHSELKGDTYIVISYPGETLSPLEDPEADELAVLIIKGMSKEISTETINGSVSLTFAI